VYCGNLDEVTEDHVIPKCLFLTGRPGDMPKVNACKACNNAEKSVNDTYLRDFLLLDMDSAEQPVPQQLFEKFARAVHRDQSIFAHHAMRSQPVELKTPSGLFAGLAYGIQLPDERITKELTMIVRGLYYAYIDERLPQMTPFEVIRQRDMSEVEANIQVLLKLGGKYMPVGDGDVFECVYGCAVEKPDVSLWYLNFYRRVVFSVATNRRGSPGNNR